MLFVSGPIQGRAFASAHNSLVNRTSISNLITFVDLYSGVYPIWPPGAESPTLSPKLHRHLSINEEHSALPLQALDPQQPVPDR